MMSRSIAFDDDSNSDDSSSEDADMEQGSACVHEVSEMFKSYAQALDGMMKQGRVTEDYLNIWADEFSFEDPVGTPAMPSREQIIAFLEGLIPHISSIALEGGEPTSFEKKEDNVFDWEVTFMMHPKDGSPAFGIPVKGEWTVSGGKIKKARTWFDMAHVVEMLGLGGEDEEVGVDGDEDTGEEILQNADEDEIPDEDGSEKEEDV